MVCDTGGGPAAISDSMPTVVAGGPSDLFALFGKGYLAITFDQPATDERYQGIVPLEGEGLAQAAQSYFSQSEQIPSIVRLATRKDADGWVAGGIMFQHLPEGEEGRERLHTRLDHPNGPRRDACGVGQDDELTDLALAATFVWRLVTGEEVRTLDPSRCRKGALQPGLYRSVLSRCRMRSRRKAGEAAGARDCEFAHQLPDQHGCRQLFIDFH